MNASRIAGAFFVLLLAATSCAKVLGIQDAQLEPESCGLATGDSCTQHCIDQSCCSETSACMKDAICATLVACVAACGKNDTSCQSACVASHPAAAVSFYAMGTCLSNCGCDTLSGVGGASAQGGISGTGGTARSVGGSSNAVGGTGASGAASALDAAIQRFSQADCGRFEACAPGWMALAYGATAECIRRDTLEYQWMAKLPGIGWNAENFIACGNALATSSCAQYLDAATPAACLISGTLPLGAACNSGYQCTSLLCDSDGTSCGHCAAPPNEGQACVAGGCAPGLTCTDDGMCRRPRDLHEACSANLPCQTRLACSLGRCVAPITTLGTACDTSISLNCDTAQSLVCATQTKTCVSVTAYANPGQTCGVGPSSGVATMCARGSCGDSGICEGRAADHGDCDDSLGPYCEWPAFCASGTCVLEKDLAVCQ